MQEQILAALKKLGPTSPGTLEDHLGASHAGLGRHLKEMLDAGTIKAAGVTKSRRLALPDQDFGDKPAPPPAPQAEAAREARPAQGREESATAPARRRREAAGRALHHRGRRRLAPDHRQRRRAADFHGHADRGDRLAPLPALQGLTP